MYILFDIKPGKQGVKTLALNDMCYKTTHTAKPFQEQLKKDLPLQENGQEVTRILFEHFLVKTDFFELEFFQVFNFVFSEFCYIFMKN